MSSLVRTVLSALLALVLVFAASPSRAQELRPTPSAGAPLSSPKVAPVRAPRLTPSDVPEVSVGAATIPPVPTSWQTHDIGWLKLSYPSSATERVAPLIADAEKTKAQLKDLLGQDVLDHVEVRITPTVSDMAMLAPVGAPPPAYASGVAYPKLRLILISMMAPRGGDATDLAEVFRHELAHAALEDAVLGRHVPAWFNEGLAVGFAGENSFDRQKVLTTAAINGTLLPLADLDRSFPSDPTEVSVAYAESVDFLLFLQARTDRLRFAATIQRVRDGQTFERALADAYGTDLRKLEFEWRTAVERKYSVYPLLAGGGALWVGLIGALGWGFMKKRRRTKAILAKWAEDDAIEDALLAQRAREAADLSEMELAHLSMGTRAPAKIEHDGSWHTLH